MILHSPALGTFAPSGAPGLNEVHVSVIRDRAGQCRAVDAFEGGSTMLDSVACRSRNDSVASAPRQSLGVRSTRERRGGLER